MAVYFVTTYSRQVIVASTQSRPNASISATMTSSLSGFAASKYVVNASAVAVVS